ncbi:MAG: hypothetical protein ABSH39_00250 [Candidatus Acidiferrum sp.]
MKGWYCGLGLLLIAFAACVASAASGVSATDDGPCCGPISASGQKLAALIDSMNVEAHWPAHEHVNWETGDPDRGGENEGPGHTHCSAFAAAVAKRMGIYLLRPPEHGQKLLANAQASWLPSAKGREGGWSPLKNGQEAQELANKGNLVVVVFANPDAQKPGHAAIVRPSDKSVRALRLDGPQITQAGTHNHNSTVLRIGFRSHPGAFPDGVRYYVHAVEGVP